MKQEKKEIFPPKPAEYEVTVGEERVLIREEERSRFEAGDKTDRET